MACRPGEWTLSPWGENLRGGTLAACPSTGTPRLQACLPEVREDTRAQSQKHDAAAKGICGNASLQNQKTQELRQEGLPNVWQYLQLENKARRSI